MLARLQRVDRDEAVLAVRRAHVHDVDRLVLQQLFVIGVDLRTLCAVLRAGLLRALLDDVAERDELGVRLAGQRGHVLAVGDAAAADDADSEFTFHGFLPPCAEFRGFLFLL